MQKLYFFPAETKEKSDEMYIRERQKSLLSFHCITQLLHRSNNIMSETPAGRKIIIAYDGSEASRQVLEWVNSHSILLPTDQVTVAIAINEDGVRLEGLGGMEAPVLGGLEGSREFREVVKELEKEGKEKLAEAVYALKEVGVKNVQAEVLRGRAPEQITEFAKKQGADIVICGNRGHGFLKRKLLGSTSEYLTHHLESTVMVVRSQADIPNKKKL